MYQKITIIGNLGRDPEMRYTPSGSAVTNFSVATSRKWKSQEGTPGEETVWFRVSAWGRLAEVCNEFLNKGKQVFIEGTLVPDPETGGPKTYERNDGSTGASFEIRAGMVKFLGGRGDATAKEVSSGDSGGHGDIPF